MRSLVPPEVPVRTLQATLIAPTAGELEIEAQVLRTGKNATHVEARIRAQGVLCAVLVGVFGTALRSAVAIKPAQDSVVGGEPIRLPYMPGVTPAFLQHFDARILRGALPFSGMALNEGVYEVDLLDAAPRATEFSVAAVADFPPPLALAHLKSFAPGSTLTWMLEYLADSFDDVPLTGFRLDVRLRAAQDGYTNQSTTVWSASGRPLALSHQTMLVFG